jgi:hypothetical protein
MFFRMKNAPTVFFRIVDAKFKYFIHKFLEMYLDDWMVFNTFLGLHKLRGREELMNNISERVHPLGCAG